MSHLSHPVQQARLVTRGSSSRLQAPAWSPVVDRFMRLLPFLTTSLNFPWSRHSLTDPYPDVLQQEGREGTARSGPDDGST